MLNFGDFSRYGKSFKAVKKGNFLGLPVNFLVFSLLVVVTAAATRAGVRRADHRPGRRPSPGSTTPSPSCSAALTFMIATVGINIVANFVSPGVRLLQRQPAEDQLADGRHDRRRRLGAASPRGTCTTARETIHYTLDILGAFIGPLFGVLIADYYLVQQAAGRASTTCSPWTRPGSYHYTQGLQPGRRRAPPRSPRPWRDAAGASSRGLDRGHRPTAGSSAAGSGFAAYYLLAAACGVAATRRLATARDVVVGRCTMRSGSSTPTPPGR